MPRTDTQALAKAIDEFEAEFPDLTWSLCQSAYVYAHNRDQTVAAHANGYDVATHAEAFANVTALLRAMKARDEATS